MSARADDFLSKTAQVDQAAIRPFPNSRKIYVQGSRPDIRVPMREISLAATPAGIGVGTQSADDRLRHLRALHRSRCAHRYSCRVCPRCAAAG